MNGYLLDTNVISMLAPHRADTSATFVQWLEQVDSDGRAFLSVVAIHEMEKGIALLAKKGARAKAAALQTWLSELIMAFSDKILAFDISAAALAGQLEAKAMSSGHDPGMADAMIAGIAKANGLIVLTNNSKHFRPFDIDVVTPDEAVQGI